MIESVSRRAFSGSSGTYNVRASELARDKKLKTLAATVVFLDDSQHCFQLEVKQCEMFDMKILNLFSFYSTQIFYSTEACQRPGFVGPGVPTPGTHRERLLRATVFR